MPPKVSEPIEVGSDDILLKPNVVNALSYVPYFIGAVSMYFLGKTEKKVRMHHIKYSAMLAFGAIVLAILLKGVFGQMVALAYLVISGIFAFKAYKGEEVRIELLDTIEEKVNSHVSK